jgi:anti-sigma B factor antagonist
MPQDAPRPASTRLRLAPHRRDDTTVIECAGRLTFEHADALKDLGKSLIPQSKRIVLDLKEVTRMDSGGLGAVVGLYISARKANCDFVLINYNSSIEDLLKVAHLLSILSGDVG